MGHSLAISSQVGSCSKPRYLQLIVAAKEKPVFYNGINRDIAIDHTSIAIDHTSWEAPMIFYTALALIH